MLSENKTEDSSVLHCQTRLFRDGGAIFQLICNPIALALITLWIFLTVKCSKTLKIAVAALKDKEIGEKGGNNGSNGKYWEKGGNNGSNGKKTQKVFSRAAVDSVRQLKIEFIRFPNGRRNNLKKLNIPRQTPRFFNFVLRSNHFADCSWKGKGSGYLVVFVDLILTSELIWINIFCRLLMKGSRWISCSICKSNFKFKSDLNQHIL